MLAARWIALIGASALCAVACSDTKFDPSGSTSTDGGVDGAAGAGSGGADAAVACKKNDDCDDGKACNGTETCDANFCKPGTAFCTNADPANCDVLCTESGSVPSCSTDAKDADDDGHGSVLCTAAPGDDCDDADKTVHPGATEQCDGVDSDCDGLADIDDGFALSGTDADLVTVGDPERPHAAWSPDAKRWGVVWDDTRNVGNTEVYFAVLDDTGKRVFPDVRISTAAGLSAAPRVAWGHNSFAIVWQDREAGNDDILVRLVDAAGSPKGPAQKVVQSAPDSYAADIVATPSGFLVTYTTSSTSTSELQAQLLTKTGDLDGVDKLLSTSGHNVGARLALVGKDVAIGYVTAAASAGAFTSADAVVVNRVSAFLDLLGEEKVSKVPPVRKVDFYLGIAPTSTGYGVLYNLIGPGNKLAYVERKADGSAVCGPVELTDVVETTTEVVAWVSGLVPTKNGPLGLSVDGAKTGHMLLVRPGCTPQSAVPLSSAIAGRPFGALSVGDGKILAVWNEQPGSKLVLKTRVFGEDLCN